MKCSFVLVTVMAIIALARAAHAMTLGQYELGWARYWAQRDGVPLALVEAIIVVESGGNPYAVSPKGAAGIMQLMPETAYDFGVSNRFLIQENTRAGVAYLAWLIREFRGDLRLVVASYYAGDRLIEREGLSCSSPEIYNYVAHVAAIYHRLEASGR